MPRAKIICTLGPASDRYGVLLKMMRLGMDVVRLNFSHGSLEQHSARISLVRELNKKYRRRIKILGDLEGYRIRIGRLKGARPVAVKRGQLIWLTQEDILAIRDYLDGFRQKVQVVAKIENREGIKNIDDIIRACDGIMVARGDMGISIPIYEVPMVQKEIIRKCNHARTFAITATQMLESMTENHMPTRAEVSDVANAILDGSDYLMLSAESAVGLYPAACVDIMNKIIKFTENSR